MKTAILTITLLLYSITELSAQVSYRCSHREYCIWNVETEDFELCEGYDESSLFEIDFMETKIVHTTDSLQSTYHVNSKEYSEEEQTWIYDVTSDAGYDFKYIFDEETMEIRAFVITEEESMILIAFTIKNIF